MKYNSSNKPLVCMQTQSTCYKGTSKMTIKGVLWHSTGANNKTLKRYVQPSDIKPAEDTYSKEKWLEILGKNQYNNDWNHISHQAGLNAWIGALADGTVTTVQTMPWDFKPWGCGIAYKGGPSCNNGWVQFEICEDALTDKNYFNKVYNEACELTAYICKMYNIDPNGKVSYAGKQIPTILCHQDSYRLGVGGNHGDIYHWFPKHGKDMDTVRADVAALLKNSGSIPAKPATPVLTYKVVTPVNKYLSAEDAATKKNAKADKLPVGTYYIYTKYPNGVNGMYNISTDKTGSSAGCWINPKDNVLTESTEAPAAAKLYRVRKTKDDVKSQFGAYSELQNAIDACQSAGQGYHVFDCDFNIVYSYKKPVQVPSNTEQEKPIAVYDLDYPDKVKIVDNSIKVTDAELSACCVKAIKKILTNNKGFDIEIAKAFFKHAPRYGIDPVMAIAQSILETGWFKFAGSSVKADQHNYCGLGATGGGASGASFATVHDGVLAQLQHLYAYGCKEAVPAGDKILDPRFSLVTRGIAPYWQQLAGRWACPGYDTNTYETPQKAMEASNTYGQKIITLYNSIVSTEVTEAEIALYFENSNTNTVEPDVDIDQKTEEEIEQTTEKANRLAILIFNCLKKLIQLLADVFNKGE